MFTNAGLFLCFRVPWEHLEVYLSFVTTATSPYQPIPYPIPPKKDSILVSPAVWVPGLVWFGLVWF